MSFGIYLTISLTVSLSYYYSSTSVISSQNQSISNLQSSLTQANKLIALQNNTIVSQQTTINTLQNSSDVKTFNLLKDQLAAKEKELQNVTEQLDDAKATVVSLTSENTQLKQKVSTLEAQVTQITAQRDRLQHILDTYWVTATGKASTSGAGTSAKWIYFYANGMRFGAPVTDNVYTVRLPNNSTYSIFIHWTSAVNQDVCDTRTSFYTSGNQINYTVPDVKC